MSSKFLNLNDKSIPRKIEADFNIKVYREKLNEKYARSPIQSKFESSNTATPIKSSKASQHPAPTFDSLQNRIRDYSFNKLKNTQSETFLFKQDQKQASPSRVSGMQQKISQIGQLNGIPAGSQIYCHTLKSGRQSSMYAGPITDDRRPLQSPSSPFRHTRFETESAERLDFMHNKPITQLVPLHEIVNLRNKIEQANMSIGNLTPTYTSEMVRLAQAITSSLKKK